MENYIKIICENCKDEICLVPRNIEAPVEVSCLKCWAKDKEDIEI